MTQPLISLIEIYMKNYTIFVLTILSIVLAGCRSSRMTELHRFERSVLKDFPFSVDSVSWLTSGDFPTFRFANAEYTDARPDAEIHPNGDYWVCNMFDAEHHSAHIFAIKEFITLM